MPDIVLASAAASVPFPIWPFAQLRIATRSTTKSCQTAGQNYEDLQTIEFLGKPLKQAVDVRHVEPVNLLHTLAKLVLFRQLNCRGKFLDVLGHSVALR